MQQQSKSRLNVNDIVTLQGRIVECDNLSGIYRIELLDTNNMNGYPSQHVTIHKKYIHALSFKQIQQRNQHQTQQHQQYNIKRQRQIRSSPPKHNHNNNNNNINNNRLKESKPQFIENNVNDDEEDDKYGEEYKYLLKSKCAELIIYGYIRDININNNIKRNIEIGIINKCYQFIVQNTYFVGWTSRSHSDDHNTYSISISNTDNYSISNAHCLNIKELDDEKNKIFVNKQNITKCLSTNISLPQWIINKYGTKMNYSENKKYHYLIHCGRERSSTHTMTDNAPVCDLIIINDNELNIGYHLSLPITNKILQCSTSIYNDTNNTIYSVNGWSDIGGVGSDPSISSLNLQTMKWNIDRLKTKIPRQSTSLLIIPSINKNHNRLCVIGGFHNFQSVKTVELFTLNDDDEYKHNYLCDLNYGRENLSSLYISEINKIIVGGGTSMKYNKWFSRYKELNKNVADPGKIISNSMEIYDFHKNKWYFYPYSTNFIHDNKSLLWHDNINPNIIYFAGKREKNNNKQNYCIECIDLRYYEKHKKNKWIKLENKTIEQMLDLKKHDFVSRDQTSSYNRNTQCFSSY